MGTRGISSSLFTELTQPHTDGFFNVRAPSNFEYHASTGLEGYRDWAINSSLVDYLNIYLLCMDHYNKEFNIKAYFTCLDFLDIYHVVPEENLQRFQMMHDLSTTLTRAYLASIYGLK